MAIISGGQISLNSGEWKVLRGFYRIETGSFISSPQNIEEIKKRVSVDNFETHLDSLAEVRALGETIKNEYFLTPLGKHLLERGEE